MLVLHMLTICGAIISALNFKSSNIVAIDAESFRNCLWTNSVVIFGNLNGTFSGFFCLINVLILQTFDWLTLVVIVPNFDVTVAKCSLDWSAVISAWGCGWKLYLVCLGRTALVVAKDDWYGSVSCVDLVIVVQVNLRRNLALLSVHRQCTGVIWVFCVVKQPISGSYRFSLVDVKSGRLLSSSDTLENIRSMFVQHRYVDLFK